MNIPNLPHPSIPLSKDSGHIHERWYDFFEQLTTQLQQNASEEGLGLPQQNTSNIAILQASNPKPSIVVNSDTGKPFISVNGVYKEIQTT